MSKQAVDPAALTVEDINEINRALARYVDALPWDQRLRIGALSWKLVFLGQQIEQRAKQAEATPAPGGEEREG